jgi:hypothetical protein
MALARAFIFIGNSCFYVVTAEGAVLDIQLVLRLGLECFLSYHKDLTTNSVGWIWTNKIIIVFFSMDYTAINGLFWNHQVYCTTSVPASEYSTLVLEFGGS